MSKQSKIQPVGIEVGDRYETPLNTVKVIDIEGDYENGEDKREWLIEDEETGEEKWVDFEWFLIMMRSRLNN